MTEIKDSLFSRHHHRQHLASRGSSCSLLIQIHQIQPVFGRSALARCARRYWCHPRKSYYCYPHLMMFGALAEAIEKNRPSALPRLLKSVVLRSYLLSKATQ